MPKKIAHEDAEAVMLAARLRPLDPYPGGDKPWRCQCLNCEREVTPRFRDVRGGKSSGCGYCARTKVHPLEAVEFMRKAGLEPLTPYANSARPWPCRCLSCGYEVNPSYSSVQQGKRCIYCAGNKVDPMQAEKEMIAAGVKPLEPYSSSGKSWKCQCLTCGKTVSPRYGAIQSGQGGCVYCAGNRVEPDEAVERMRAAGVEPLEPFPGAHKGWLCRCTTCGREVRPRYVAIAHGDQGACRYCGIDRRAEGQRLDGQQAAALMRSAGLEPLVDYPGAMDPWLSRCEGCGKESSPTYSNVRTGHGCKFCATHGFDFSKPAYVYVLTHPEFNAHKVGIGGAQGVRLVVLGRRGWMLYKKRTFTSGDEAFVVEQKVLTIIRNELGIPPYLDRSTGEGHTETLSADSISLEALWKLVSDA